MSVADYNALRKAVGWSELKNIQAQTGIRNSAFLVAAVFGDKTIGMARVLGDGGYIALIADVMVLPQFQGKGIGKKIMRQCMNFIKCNLKEQQSAFINLMAAPGKEPFYANLALKPDPMKKQGRE